MMSEKDAKVSSDEAKTKRELTDEEIASVAGGIATSPGGGGHATNTIPVGTGGAGGAVTTKPPGPLSG
jgi:hypothetical protein